MSLFDFVMTYDFDRPEAEILCDLVYMANQYKLQPSAVQFLDVKALDPRPAIEDDPNSYISAIVSKDYDYRMVVGETGFLYTRIPLAALRPLPNTTIQPLVFPFSTYDVIDQINRHLGTRLTTDDLEDTVYTTLNNDFTIQAKPTSKVWIGERILNVLGGGKEFILFLQSLLFGFTGPTDIQGDHRTQLAQIANADNSTNWQEGIDFEFGRIDNTILPVVGRNTRIYLKALKPGYIDQWLYYVRVDPQSIDDQFGGSIPKVTVPNDPFSTHGILDKINATLNLNLTTDDVEDTPYLPGASQYPMVFKSGNLAWLPGVYNLNVEAEPLSMANVRLVGDGSYRVRGDGTYSTYQ